MAAITAVWPVAEFPYADDWAYTHMALQLERTGRLVYNGWESAMLIPHIYWGALFVRLFGFSFTGLRISTLPFAAGSVGLCYLLMRRLGLAASAAFFATLLVGLSPVFLPASVSFMSDVPCVFFTLLSLYALIRAAASSGVSNLSGEAKPTSATWRWLAAGALSGFVGGADRQIVWLVPLLLLPYIAWFRRRIRALAGACLGIWGIELVGVLAMTAWFRRQPYTLYQFPLFSEVRLAMSKPLLELNIATRTGLMMILLVLPGALPFLVSAASATLRGSRFRKTLTGALLTALVAALWIHPNLASIPWISSTLNWEGINGEAELPGRPVVLIRPIRAVVAVSVYVAAILLLVELWERRKWLSHLVRFFLHPLEAHFPLAASSLFAIAYMLVMMVRASRTDIFDRYFLPVLPWFAALAPLWHQSVHSGKHARRGLFAAWSLLIVYGIYAIASSQDLMALARARAAAAARLESAGVSRAAIDAGFEYNGWTELMNGGYANHRFLLNPSGAYRPGLGLFPGLRPLYRLEHAPTADSVASQFGSVPYVSLMPPFRKQVSIDRITSPTTLNFPPRHHETQSGVQ